MHYPLNFNLWLLTGYKTSMVSDASETTDRIDINSRIFLLKFALPDSKRNVLVESGFRIHLTNYSREKSSSPSHFVAKVCVPLGPRLIAAPKIPKDKTTNKSFPNRHRQNPSPLLPQ